MARPQLEFISTGPSKALIFKIDRDLWPVYHYHPEFDILLSLKDHGGEFISGDHIGQLKKGTLFMNGPNIPHALHSGRENDGDWARPSLAVIQFSRESLGEELLSKMEMLAIREFLDEARLGFEFTGSTATKASAMIMEMEHQSPLERFTQLLRLLQLFADSPEKQSLASPAYSPSLKKKNISRLDEVLTFLQQKKTETITLERVAAIAKMSPKSFCRFFKSNTGKTLVQYLHELRIGEACRLLLEDDSSISDVAFDCGFHNLSNFNRHFRKLKGTTPGQFRKQYQIASSEQQIPLPRSI
ncbi:AraC family transcriptional regulator [Verrucomicrobiales bacterium BCK34]|nr:AraC family transcriptional regulator [Verrucomicrobiales bacterium BCK34]